MTAESIALIIVSCPVVIRIVFRPNFLARVVVITSPKTRPMPEFFSSSNTVSISLDYGQF